MHEDEDDIPRIHVEPGPNMRWLEQGFFMGLGFICASLVAGTIAGIMILIVALWP